MSVSILIISILIFLDNIGYGIYEIRENKNRLGGTCVIIVAIVMIIFVNYAMITFK